MLKQIAIGLMFSLSLNTNASTIFFEDFETDDSKYTTSIPEFTNTKKDYFLRAKSATRGGDMGEDTFYNKQGDYIFAAQDIDANGANLPVILSFTNINISGVSSLRFSILLAEDDDGTAEDWDANDYFHATYTIDDGPIRELFALENDGSNRNSAAFFDTDYDGTGDGNEITDTFTKFETNILGDGNSLNLYFEFSLNEEDEDIALDNIFVTGDIVPVPIPTSGVLLGTALLALSYRKRRTLILFRKH